MTLDAILPHDALESAHKLIGVCGITADGHKQAGRIFAKFGGVPPVPDATSGTFGAHIKKNIPAAAIAAPVLVAQRLSDNVVNPAVTDAYVAARCKAGMPLDYWVFPGETHFTIVAPGSPLEEPLVHWTQDRFDGKQSAAGCHDRSIRK